MNCEAALGSRTPFASPYGEQRGWDNLGLDPLARRNTSRSLLEVLASRIWVEALDWGARPVQAPPPLPSRTWKHKAGVSSPTLLLAKHSLLLYVCLSHTQSKSSPIKWAEGSSISMNQLYWVPVSTGTMVYGRGPVDKTSHQHDIILGSTN